MQVNDADGHLLQTLRVPITETDLRQARLILPPLTVRTYPAQSQLLQNYPNPFNPETWMPYQLAQPADVTIWIYDAHGRLVRTLLLGQQAAGFYLQPSEAAHWDGRNAQGESVSSGVYFYQLITGDFTQTRRMVILK